MPRVLPTLARIMLYAPENTDPGYLNQPGQRMPAMVTGVDDVGPTVPTYDQWRGEETWVAVTVFPPSRSPFCRCVPVHFGDGVDQIREGGFVEWMPYQKGQAAKTEELEAKVLSQEMEVLSRGNQLGPGPLAHSYGAGFPGSCEPVRERPDPAPRRWLGFYHHESTHELRIALGGVDLFLRQGMSDAVIYGALRTAADRVLQQANETVSNPGATKV